MAQDSRDRDRERAAGGEYVETVTPESALAVFNRLDDPGEPLTAREVADALGRDRKTAYNKLDALAERGDVVSKKVGGRARVWWPAPDLDHLLQRASAAFGTAITANGTVYEDGDAHPLDESANKGEGAVEEGEPA